MVSNTLLCDMVHSSQTINLQSLSTSDILHCFEIEQWGVLKITKSKGSLNAEWAVRPPLNRVAAISEEATARAIFLDFELLTSINLSGKSYLSLSVHPKKDFTYFTPNAFQNGIVYVFLLVCKNILCKEIW